MGKRGPAAKGEYSGKSKVLSTRIRPDTRAALETATQKSGWSLSQEIEHRLRRTFIEDEKIEEAFGSRQTFNIMRTVAMALQLQSSILPPRKDGLPQWLADAELFDDAVLMIGKVLAAVRPADAETTVNKSEQERADDELIAESVASATWSLISLADPDRQITEGTLDDHRKALLKIDLAELLKRAKSPQNEERRMRMYDEMIEWAQRLRAEREKDENDEG